MPLARAVIDWLAAARVRVVVCPAAHSNRYSNLRWKAKSLLSLDEPWQRPGQNDTAPPHWPDSLPLIPAQWQSLCCCLRLTCNVCSELLLLCQLGVRWHAAGLGKPLRWPAPCVRLLLRRRSAWTLLQRRCVPVVWGVCSALAAWVALAAVAVRRASVLRVLEPSQLMLCACCDAAQLATSQTFAEVARRVRGGSPAQQIVTLVAHVVEDVRDYRDSVIKQRRSEAHEFQHRLAELQASINVVKAEVAQAHHCVEAKDVRCSRDARVRPLACGATNCLLCPCLRTGTGPAVCAARAHDAPQLRSAGR